MGGVICITLYENSVVMGCFKNSRGLDDDVIIVMERDNDEFQALLADLTGVSGESLKARSN
jgi:hypothetical protein